MNYTIQFENKKIIVTKKFLKLAQEINSEEYQTILTLMKDFPSFTIRVRKQVYTPKRTYAGLTYESMRNYIEENNNEYLADFETVLIYCKHYSQVKSWFINMFPEYSEQIKKIA